MIRITKLNQVGDHLIIIGVFIVLFGVAGTFFLLKDHAASPTYYNLKLQLDSSFCMDNHGDSSSSSGVYMYPCNSGGTDQGEEWSLIGSVPSSFLIESPKGTCVANENGIGSAGNRHYLSTASCNSSDSRQLWRWSSSELVNRGSGGCINDPGNAKSTTQLISYPCGSKPGSNYQWSQTTLPSSGGGGNSGGGSSVGAELLGQAKKFGGITYLYGGGHAGWATYKKDCLGNNQTGTPRNNGSCQVDCSGLISMATDMALGTNYDWTVGGATMNGTGSSHWHAISMSSVQPGDIVTSDEHVEFVYSGSGSSLRTLGAHNSSNLPTDGVVSATGFGYTNAYRYE